jgi:LacI family transcriptional regulator
MRISLQTVALRLGLNRSTVSRALRHDPSIPEKTRKLIQSTCKEMGYRPSSIISELASSRWQADKASKGSVIAYLNCFQPKAPVGFKNVPALQGQAQLLGYRLENFNRFDYTNSKLQARLRARGITDVILGPVYDESMVVELDWEKFICVQLLPGFFSKPLHSVVKDPFNSVLLAWKKAVSYGYQRIGIVLMRHRVPVMDDIMRLSAVDACQRHLFPKLARLPVYEYDGNDWRVKNFAKWCERQQPDVIIGFSEGVYEGYQAEFHREIPFVCLHLNDRNPMRSSGIPEAADSCAREAVNLLHFCRRTYQWGIPKERIDHVVEPTWFEGTSMPRKNGSPLEMAFRSPAEVISTFGE